MSVFAQDNLFYAPQEYLSSSEPFNVVFADLNHDGVPDAIVPSSRGLDVFLGQPGGALANQPTNLNFYNSGPSAAVSDFDGDGNPDIAGTDWKNNFVYINYGNGAGGFSGLTQLPIPCNRCTIAAADFNRDGYGDLAVVSSSEADIYLGDGAGGFVKTAQSFSLTNGVFVVAGELNHDHYPDLIVLDAGAQRALVLLNGHSATFIERDLALGPSANTAVIADLNGDGLPDIAVNDRDSDQVYVFLNSGAANFDPPQSYSAGCTFENPPGCSLGGLAAGDFNKDGFVDIASPGSILYNRGDGSFEKPVPYRSGQSPASVAAAQFPGVVNSVLLVPNENTADISFVQLSPPTLSKTSLIPVGNNPTSVDAADFNGDGNLDMIVAVRGEGVGQVLFGEGDGAFLPGPSLAASGAASALARDLNRDGIIDIVLGGREGTWIYLGQGNGVFRLAGQYPSFYGDCTATKFDDTPSPCLAAGDINGDGIIDLVGADRSRGQILTMLGNGDGTFRPGPTTATGGTPLQLTLADFNGDGILDIAVPQYEANVDVFPGNGDGSFGLPYHISIDFNTMRFATAGDLNKDGKLDLVVGGGAGGGLDSYVVVYVPGNGDGTFGAPATFRTDFDPNALVIVDVNNDGNPDIVSANFVGDDFSVLDGRGNGQFSWPYNYGAGLEPIDIITGDFNGDGLPDIAVVNYDSNNVFVALHVPRSSAF